MPDWLREKQICITTDKSLCPMFYTIKFLKSVRICIKVYVLKEKTHLCTPQNLPYFAKSTTAPIKYSLNYLLRQ